MDAPGGSFPSGLHRPADLNPRQRLERPLSLTTRLRERPGSVRGTLFEPFSVDRGSIAFGSSNHREGSFRGEAPKSRLYLFDT
jgi:hypothetical protein